ncbi:MAG: hypothetical protein ACLPN2_19835 [Terriglobales bacterium]
MNSKRDAVLHDAASLFRFVDSICSICRTSGEHPSYLESSQIFFQYIHSLGDRTKAYLQQFSQALNPDNEITFYADRQMLATLRLTWFEFHKLVRPAVDAHSLHIPFPLLLSLLRRFKSVQGAESKDFIIFHTDTVNYFEGHALVRGRASELRQIVPNAPVFPENLGIIEFPYSQADSVFLNCLIAHEMGHFLFDELPETASNRLLRTIRDSMKSAFGSAYAALSSQDVLWCRDRLLSWAEEIFCDFFAIWMVGPCFSLAYIELLDLSVGLYPSPGASKAYAMLPWFTDSHPARLFRLREHVHILRSIGWWPEVAQYRSHYIELLEQAALTPTFRFDPKHKEKGHLAGRMLEAFYVTTPEIQNIVRELMVGVDSGLEGYLRYHQSIEQYLSHGVIPSTVMLEKSLLSRSLAAVGWGSEPHGEHPGFVPIINAAYKFYLESLPRLLRNIEDADDRSCIDRNHWMTRLEMWTMKAIEDSELLAGMEGR